MTKRIEQYLFPDELKTMSQEELASLSPQIRDFLIDHLSRTGGHLASNLGVVELTIALHAVFDSPKDKLIWDVGHQSYVHKILTGRASGFSTLRQKDGLSGFPKTSESPHDVFDTGHASNSLSVAAGLAKARDLRGGNENIVAIIGDGALTGGLAYEGLNNIGGAKTPVIVILNDNGMSISKNIGGVSRHLYKVRVSAGYYKFKSKVRKMTHAIPLVGRGIYSGIQHIRDTIKYAVVTGVIFEQLGFTYIGPINGHGIKEMMEAFALAKQAKGPVLIHVLTEKGKGYRNAELNPGKFHGTGPFDPATGCPSSVSRGQTYSEIFGEEMLSMAEQDQRLVGVTAAMADGTGLGPYGKENPSRFFDVGIAEGHAVTFAAGLCAGGYRPVVAIYSTFLQRSYDQIMMDVCLQNLPVIFAIDRAGNVGADGETHHGLYDISYLKSMPNMTILAPSNGDDLRQMLHYAILQPGPVAIRYPRGKAPQELHSDEEMPWGNPTTPRQLFLGRDVQILAVGSMVETAILARNLLLTKGIDVGVTDVRCLKPLNETALLDSVHGTPLIVTLEDHCLIGGFGDSVASAMAGKSLRLPFLKIGWPDRFIEHASCEELFHTYGLDAPGVAERIRQRLETTT